MNAIREAALGGTPLPDLLLCLVLGAIYVGLGILVARPRARRRPAPRGALADMTSLRIFAVGGLISYRALFDWLSLWIYVPSLVLAPIFQILLFAYIGRSAGLESDQFYVVGNAIQYAAVPCLFAMTQLIGGEKYQNTLGAILVSPAPRLPLFFGRTVPVVVNGRVRGRLLADGRQPDSRRPHPRLLVPPARARDPRRRFLLHGPRADQRGARRCGSARHAVLSNVIFGFLLIFTGANVPL